MRIGIDEIKRDVRVALDMNKRGDSLLEEGDPDTLELEEIIGSKIEEGIDLVHLEAPLTLLEATPIGTWSGTAATGMDGMGKGKMALPADFLRLVVFRLTSWLRPVYEPIEETSGEYTLQSSRWKGVYGSPEKPVVAITQRYSAQLYLEYYSGVSNDKIEEAAYIPKAKISGGEVNVSEKCYRAAIYRIGALVLATMGSEQATTLIEMSKALIN